MKILQVLNSPNWSGASDYCVTLCKLLIDRGHEVLLLTEPGKPFKKASELGINCDDSIRLNHRNPMLYIHSLKKFKKVLTSFKPDILSSHINEGAWMAGMMARKYSPETIVIRSRTDIDPPKGHFINRYVHHTWTDRLIVSSMLHKKLCTQLLDMPQEKIDVVYGAIDTEKFKPDLNKQKRFRSEYGADSNTVIIGMVARLDPVKGHEYTLEALGMLKKNKYKFLAVFMGYESQRTFSWLKDKARYFGIEENIRCPGYVENLEEAINGIDIGVVSSIASEANSRVTLEFMATGKPVIATTVGVIPEIIINGENGLLIPPADSQSLFKSLTGLFNDSPLKYNLGKQARISVEKNFTLDRFVLRTEAIYKNSLEKNPNK
ncbi:MAG: glycosyltransferase family 4 protein [Candidatus Riflebacteria bacterium]|nr:glycosyltransferase family 4 protein [Candidatus Riflebacteria bacterium]